MLIFLPLVQLSGFHVRVPKWCSFLSPRCVKHYQKASSITAILVKTSLFLGGDLMIDEGPETSQTSALDQYVLHGSGP